MKVLLKEDINNLCYAGEVMEVANGYGRNYLIPRGMAVKVTPGVLKSAETWRDRAAIRMQEVKKEHQALAERIQVTTLDFIARAGETGKLYGSITTADIAEQLNEALGTDIDRRIIVGDPLRQLGEHNITVRLSRDFQPEVTVIVNQFEEEIEEEIAEVEVLDVETNLDSDEAMDDVTEAEEESVESELEEAEEENAESELEEAEPDEAMADEENAEADLEDAEANELLAEEET